MKKIVGFLCAITIISVITIKAYREYDGLKVSDIVLANIEALADRELNIEMPEVEIICGEVEGRCWDGDCVGYSATPFGVYRSWDCHTFTGSQSDACFNGMPC